MNNLDMRRPWPSEHETGPLPMKRTNHKPLRSLDYADYADSNRGTDIWLITLSDLLMLLVIFFVVLFGMELQKHLPSISVRAESKENTLEKPIANPMEAGALEADPSLPSRTDSIEKDLVAILDRETDRQEVMVKRTANLVTLTFPERIVFDPGYARLKPTTQATLDKVASFIKERPNLIVEVQGHTDDRPINNTRYPSNWELSVDRATQVAKALIGLGVNPSRFSVKGYGEYRSLNANDSDENRSQNRRVEIQFSLPS